MRAFNSYFQKHTEKSRAYFPAFQRLESCAETSLEPKTQSKCFDIAVVIPALNERDYIQKSIDSLYTSYLCMKNNTTSKDIRVVIIVVVNNKKSHSTQIKQNSADTIACLKKQSAQFEKSNATHKGCTFSLVIGDCTQEHLCIPESEGVGLVRKIGMDYALSLGAKILTCFDADTLCESTYFETLAQYLPLCKKDKYFAGVTDFTHQKAENPSLQNTIDEYESYLKNHSKRLKECGTPYFPIALGPTLVCSAFAYVSVGGMNCRVAGEDFYFLQKLIKSSQNMRITKIDTTVYPAARLSERTLFGTGKTLSETQKNKSIMHKYTFSDELYTILKRYIFVTEEYIYSFYSDSEEICIQNNTLLEKLSVINEDLCDFLYNEGFFEVFQNLCMQSKDASRLKNAFFIWFDGLKIIRLFHRLEKKVN